MSSGSTAIASGKQVNATLSRPLVVGLCLLAFATMLTYAVANTAAAALFISQQGSKNLPWVWLLVALASAVSTALIGTLSERVDVVTLFNRAAWVSAGIFALVLAVAGTKHPAGIWGLYVFKDIYIIVLVELFWTFSNVAFGVNQASRTYGLFCAAGSMGSIVGSLILAPLGERLGILTVLWGMLPLLPLLGFGCRKLAYGIALPKPAKGGQKTPFHITLGFASVRKSHYLSLLMVLVALAQAALTLVDFQFNASLEQSFPSQADQTRLIGAMWAATNAISFVLQLLTSRWILWMGLANTFLVLPVGLGIAGLLGFAMPSLWTWVACQIIGKSLDYSLFRAAKEILYIPLSYVEKTQGKAAIDILTYRFAKGLASLVLLLLAILGAGHQVIAPILLSLCLVWLLVARVILWRHRAVLQSRARATQP